MPNFRKPALLGESQCILAYLNIIFIFHIKCRNCLHYVDPKLCYHEELIQRLGEPFFFYTDKVCAPNVIPGLKIPCLAK